MAFKIGNPGCCCECDLFRDDFTRADAVDLGSAWDSGGWGISGNAAVFDGVPSNAVAFYNTPVFGITAPEQRDAILIRVKFEVVTGDESFGVVLAADKLGDRLTIEFRGSGNGSTNCWQIDAVDNSLPLTDKTVDSYLFATFDRPVDGNGNLITGEYSMDVCFFPLAYPELSYTAAVVRGPQGNVLARSTGRDFAEGNYVGIDKKVGSLFTTPAINSFSVWTHKIDSSGFPVSANGQCPDCNVGLPCEYNSLDAVGSADGSAVKLTCDWSQTHYAVVNEKIEFDTVTFQSIISYIEDPYAAIDFFGFNGMPSHSIEIVFDPATRGTMRLWCRLIGLRGDHAWADITIGASSVTFAVGDSIQGQIATGSTGVGSGPIKATFCANVNLITVMINDDPAAVAWGHSIVGTRTFGGQNGKTVGFFPSVIASGDKIIVASVRFLGHTIHDSFCEPCARGNCVSCCLTGTTPFSIVISGFTFFNVSGSPLFLGDIVTINLQSCFWFLPGPNGSSPGDAVVDPSDPNGTITDNIASDFMTAGVTLGIQFTTDSSGKITGFTVASSSCMASVIIKMTRQEVIGSVTQSVRYEVLYQSNPNILLDGDCSGKTITLTEQSCTSIYIDSVRVACSPSPFPSSITIDL